MGELVGVVTGAGSGIGRATVEHMRACGARVAGWDLRDESLEWLRDAPDSLTATVDVRDPDQVADAAAQVRDRWGGVDFLVNSAGVF
ncbi:MAG: SDR family NAD(P)-dependent oxidoreductase, partial [Pseudonocardia sp.]